MSDSECVSMTVCLSIMYWDFHPPILIHTFKNCEETWMETPEIHKKAKRGGGVKGVDYHVILFPLLLWLQKKNVSRGKWKVYVTRVLPRADRFTWNLSMVNRWVSAECGVVLVCRCSLITSSHGSLFFSKYSQKNNEWKHAYICIFFLSILTKLAKKMIYLDGNLALDPLPQSLHSYMPPSCIKDTRLEVISSFTSSSAPVP